MQQEADAETGNCAHLSLSQLLFPESEPLIGLLKLLCGAHHALSLCSGGGVEVAPQALHEGVPHGSKGG